MNDDVTTELDLEEIQQILPHRGCALVIHKAYLRGETRATGQFFVRGDDPRIHDHFGVMPGVLIAEFAHLTASVLVMYKNREAIPVLNNTRIKMQRSAVAGDNLLCGVKLLKADRREFVFHGLVYSPKKSIAEVYFSGTAIPKKVFERQIGRV